MTQHIIPINDIEPHEESTTCYCDPKVKFEESGDMTAVHMAFDFRHEMEPEEEKKMGGWEITRSE